MFCYQCEQTFRGTGCVDNGVCGKDPVASDLQDVLVTMLKGVAMYARRARTLGVSDPELNEFALASLFATGTNVNFDAEDLELLIRRGVALRRRARDLYEQAARKAGSEVESLSGPAVFKPASDRDGLLE